MFPSWREVNTADLYPRHKNIVIPSGHATLIQRCKMVVFGLQRWSNWSQRSFNGEDSTLKYWPCFNVEPTLKFKPYFNVETLTMFQRCCNVEIIVIFQRCCWNCYSTFIQYCRFNVEPTLKFQPYFNIDVGISFIQRLFNVELRFNVETLTKIQSWTYTEISSSISTCKLGHFFNVY